MQKVVLTRLVAAASLLTLCSCARDSVVEKRPTYRYQPVTAVGSLILNAMEARTKVPQARIGKYLDAASKASEEIRANPKDPAARRDYNFAVSRVIEVLHDSNLKEWPKGLDAAGANGTWRLSAKIDPRPGRNPLDYHILPADRYELWGDYEKNRAIRQGVGAPVVVTSNGIDFTKIDRFAQGKTIFYSATVVMKFNGRNVEVSFHDPLSEETVAFNGRTHPLAADFSASIALALEAQDAGKMNFGRLLRPGKYLETARLARFQPYDPNKIPVLMVHGLMSSPATWAPLVNSLRADEDLRRKYQIWFFSYPSGLAYPTSAAELRRQLDEIRKVYPNHKKIVLIGHSMGGAISRTMMLDTSDRALWNMLITKSPEECGLEPRLKQLLMDALIYKERKELGRVILVCAPLRGSDTASNWIGRLGSSFIRLPQTFATLPQTFADLTIRDPNSLQLKRLPNSVDTLAPNNRFVVAVNKLPLNTKVPYHSIIGDRGKGGNKDKTPPVIYDGIVPYWSAHLEGAQSELIVPSSHDAHAHPAGIAEIKRILRLHGSK